MKKLRKLAAKEVRILLKQVKKWRLVGNKIERKFVFEDFQQALRFVNKVARVAEELDHHPDILIYSWNKVKLTAYTHSVGGLSENDFALAAKINKIK